MGEVYLITNNVNGKQYVGQTLKTGSRRLKEMSTGVFKGSTNLLRAAIIEFGKDSFSVSTLETCGDRQTLLAREYYWIGELDTLTPRGYNKARFLPGTTKERIPRTLAKKESKRSEKRRKREVQSAYREITYIRKAVALPTRIDNRIIIIEHRVYNDLNDLELIKALRTLGNDWWSVLTPTERIEYKWKLLDELSGQVEVEQEA